MGNAKKEYLKTAPPPEKKGGKKEEEKEKEEDSTAPTETTTSADATATDFPQPVGTVRFTVDAFNIKKIDRDQYGLSKNMSKVVVTCRGKTVETEEKKGLDGEWAADFEFA